MKNTEKKLTDLLIRNKYLLFTAVIFLLGLYARFLNKYFESEDYLIYLSKWYQQIKDAGGFTALSFQVGNYPVIYQTLIAFFTYLPISPLYAYKGLSVVFDILLCIEAARLVYALSKDRFKSYLAFSLLFLSPLVIMNSSTWGQCDSIYAYFLLLMIRKLYEEKYVSAFVFYGIAFAFKMQAIFLLPFLIYLYFAEKKFSLVHFLYAFLAMLLSNVPAFMYGRSLLAPLEVYSYLASFSNDLCMNVFNLWAIVEGDYDSLYIIALVLTMLVLGIALLYFMKENKINLKDHYLELSIWTFFTCVMFLPAMHDRYFYVVEVLMVILVLVKGRFLYETLILYLTSLQAYCAYLYYYQIENRAIIAMLMMLVWLRITIVLFKEIEQRS